MRPPMFLTIFVILISMLMPFGIAYMFMPMLMYYYVGMRITVMRVRNNMAVHMAMTLNQGIGNHIDCPDHHND